MIHERREGVSLVVLTGSPQNHDHKEDHAEEKLPIGVIDPELPPVGDTVWHSVHADGPEHENDCSHHAENERVEEVAVHSEFHYVATQLQVLQGCHERSEHPPGGEIGIPHHLQLRYTRYKRL